MKTLIIFGSPREKGNTAALVKELRRHLTGDIVEFNAFKAHFSPCIDCRGCWETANCVVKDDMQLIYNDDFDNVVIASPVYFGTFPGQVLNLMSRMQPWHVATFFLKKPLPLRPKKAAVILTAGGKGNTAKTQHHLYALTRMLNAKGFEAHTVCSDHTDTLPAAQDAQALADVARLAQWLMEEQQSAEKGENA